MIGGWSKGPRVLISYSQYSVTSSVDSCRYNAYLRQKSIRTDLFKSSSIVVILNSKHPVQS